MLQEDLVKVIAQKLPQLEFIDIEVGVNLICQYLADSLIKGQRIEIRGFGSFSVKDVPPRIARNPQTGEKIITLRSKKVHFKPGKKFNDILNSKPSVK